MLLRSKSSLDELLEEGDFEGCRRVSLGRAILTATKGNVQLLRTKHDERGGEEARESAERPKRLYGWLPEGDW